MRALQDTLGLLVDKLHLMEGNPSASWERGAADLILQLSHILIQEKFGGNKKTKPPLIFSAISEDEKIFHPFRKLKFQLIHSESFAIRADKELHIDQKLAIFTIPMLYSVPEFSRQLSTRAQKNLSGSPSQDFETRDPLRFEHPINLNKAKTLVIEHTVQGRPEIGFCTFIYENPFDENSDKKLTLKEWLEQTVLVINMRTFTIEQIIKEVRNKIAVHRAAAENIDKGSFIYNTRYINSGGAYWSYFIFFCAVYVVTIIQQKIKLKSVSKISDDFAKIAESERPDLTTFGWETKDWGGIESYIVFSDNVEFIANEDMSKNTAKIPFFCFRIESKMGLQTYSIPSALIILKTQKEKKSIDKENFLYFNLKGKKCGFGLHFKAAANAWCVLVGDKKKISGVHFGRCTDYPIKGSIFYNDTKNTTRIL